MSHKLGLHWIRTHPDGRDYSHIERMQYASAKLFEWHWSNRDACADLLTVLPKDAYILARDHPMSEQKQDMWADPVGTGTRHANEWAMKVASGNYHLPVDRTFFLPINEPDATNGDRAAIDRYTTAFLQRLRVHGLRGGAFNFSTGHPRTVDGTGNTQADYTVFEGSHQAIVEGHHIGVLHIYGATNVPCVPGHYDRLRACPWQDVEWVVGEAAIDEHVVTGGPHDGYLRTLGAGSDAYCRWLDEFIMGIGDRRIHSYQVFSYDYSHPWDSFDVRPIRDHLESYAWEHGKVAAPAQPTQTHIPVVTKPPAQATPAPIAPGIIDPTVAQAILKVESGGRTHGDNGKPIIRFEAHIFKTYLGNDALWSQHFRADANRPWVDQMWRQSPTDPWRVIHTGKQSDEYLAFDFARALSREAAYKAISMGAAQIMGFNHQRIGYASAEAMYYSFQSAPMQTLGFINFCLSDRGLIEAIRRRDWREIAKRYNGPGNVDSYSRLLQQAYEASQ